VLSWLAIPVIAETVTETAEVVDSAVDVTTEGDAEIHPVPKPTTESSSKTSPHGLLGRT